MKNKGLQAGDKVAVYDENGRRVSVIYTAGANARDGLYMLEDDSWAHPKQCRKIKTKTAKDWKVIWVHPDTYDVCLSPVSGWDEYISKKRVHRDG